MIKITFVIQVSFFFFLLLKSEWFVHNKFFIKMIKLTFTIQIKMIKLTFTIQISLFFLIIKNE